MTPTRICFVCLGNICRSPLAEGLLHAKARARGIAEHLFIASRGTGDWHLGAPADPRMQATAARHGLVLDTRSELFEDEDFEAFDLILCMDRERLAELEARRPKRARARLRLFRDFDPEATGAADVPDPYYGDGDGFEEVFSIVARTCDRILDAVEGGTLSSS